jgi:hypothetical protein
VPAVILGIYSAGSFQLLVCTLLDERVRWTAVLLIQTVVLAML